MSDSVFRIQVRADLLRRLPEVSDPGRLAARLCRVLDQQNLLTVSHIQSHYLDFPRQGPTTPAGLRNITGNYFRSLHPSAAVVTNEGVTSAIGTNVVSRAGVSYPAVHEFGATIPPHDIVARNAKALRFVGADGKVIFRRVIHHPGAVLPARRSIQRGIEDRIADYNRAFERNIEEALQA